MFQHAFQNKNFFEIFDAKTIKEKDKNLEPLFKPSNTNGISKIFDKIIRGYIYELDEAPKTKIQFPSNEKQELGLVQHFLVFQIFIPLGTPFSLEVVITDTSNNKRRLHFTTSIKEIEKSYFHIKIPVHNIKRGTWLNLSFGLLSFFELFKGYTFRSIDSFILTGACKLRKIFTMKHPLSELSSDDEFSSQIAEEQLIPKNLNFSSGVTYQNQLLLIHNESKTLDPSFDCLSKNSTNNMWQTQRTKPASRLTNLTSRTGISSNSTAAQTHVFGKLSQLNNSKAPDFLLSSHTSLHQNDNHKVGIKKNQIISNLKQTTRNRFYYDFKLRDRSDSPVLDSTTSVMQSSTPQSLTSRLESTLRDTSIKQTRYSVSSNIIQDNPNLMLNSKHKKFLENIERRGSHFLERHRRESTSFSPSRKTERSLPKPSNSRYFENTTKITSSKYNLDDPRHPVNSNPWMQNINPAGLKLKLQQMPLYSSRLSPTPSPEKKANPLPLKKRQPPPAKLTVTKNKATKENVLSPELYPTRDKFNTTARLFNPSYEPTHIEFVEKGYIMDDIESIEENLEYEMTSNNSMVNVSSHERKSNKIIPNSDPYRYYPKYIDRASPLLESHPPLENSDTQSESDSVIDFYGSTTRVGQEPSLESPRTQRLKIEAIETKLNNVTQLRPFSPPYTVTVDYELQSKS